MRIACYYPWVYLRSGIERTIVETCLRSRHEYTIFTNHFEPENTYPEFKNLRVVELDYVPVDRKLGSVLKAASVVGRQKLDLSSYDLLMVQCDGIGSLILNRKIGIPAVCVCHTPLRPVYDPHYRARALERSKGVRRLGFHLFSLTFRALDRLMWSRYKYVFFASDEGRMRAERGGLLNTMESRYEILHTGIDTTALQSSGCFEHYFLVSGRIMWTKNIGLAIHAFLRFKALSPSYKDFRLVIAGMVDRKSQEYLKELRALAEGRDDIEFVITPSDPELRELYSRCFGVLFTPFNEDWGLVPLEANACGKPVIACNRGGPRESQRHGETGFLVDSDPETFAQAMALLASDPELAQRVGAQGREHSLQYDWSNFVRRLDDVLEVVARGKDRVTNVVMPPAIV
jgi:glycosyltransferase involved in cell wall biosynthesis